MGRFTPTESTARALSLDARSPPRPECVRQGCCVCLFDVCGADEPDVVGALVLAPADAAPIGGVLYFVSIPARRSFRLRTPGSTGSARYTFPLANCMRNTRVPSDCISVTTRPCP